MNQSFVESYYIKIGEAVKYCVHELNISIRSSIYKSKGIIYDDIFVVIHVLVCFSAKIIVKARINFNKTNKR